MIPAADLRVPDRRRIGNRLTVRVELEAEPAVAVRTPADDFDPRGESTMDLVDKANDRRRMYMRDRMEHKLDEALRDNVRLEQANELLKQELEREDRERDRIWSAVQTRSSMFVVNGSRG